MKLNILSLDMSDLNNIPASGIPDNSRKGEEKKNPLAIKIEASVLFGTNAFL